MAVRAVLQEHVALGITPAMCLLKLDRNHGRLDHCSSAAERGSYGWHDVADGLRLPFARTLNPKLHVIIGLSGLGVEYSYATAALIKEGRRGV